MPSAHRSCTVTPVDYHVKDRADDQYTNTNWSRPTIVPNALIPIDITIDGNAFTFQTGNTYAVIVITSRNKFAFTIFA